MGISHGPWAQGGGEGEVTALWVMCRAKPRSKRGHVFERDCAPWLWGFPHHQSPLAGWYPTRARRIFIKRLLPWRPGALCRSIGSRSGEVQGVKAPAGCDDRYDPVCPRDPRTLQKARHACKTGSRGVLKVLVLLQLKAAMRHALAAAPRLGSRAARPSRRPRPCPLTLGRGSMAYLS